MSVLTVWTDRSYAYKKRVAFQLKGIHQTNLYAYISLTTALVIDVLLQSPL